MGIIIDIVLVVIFLICIALGYFKGLTGSLLKIISFVLALVIAFILFKPVANFIIDNTNWDENLEQSIKQTILKENNEEIQNNELQANEQIETNNQSMPTVITNYINETVEKAGEDAKNTIVNSTARSVSVTIINIGVWICLFIISRIVLILVKGLTELLTKLPIIKQVDKMGGILYGLLEALFIVYLLLAIVSFISPMLTGTSFMKALQESYITIIFYNNNLLLKLIF